METTRVVEAGDVTGIYYIAICSLPFQTTWQSLKDYLRTVCEVDYVQIFQASTSGWARFRGKENFEKAFRLLVDGTFKGRRLIATDQNRTASLRIKELVTPGSGPPFGPEHTDPLVLDGTAGAPVPLALHGLRDPPDRMMALPAGSASQHIVSAMTMGLTLGRESWPAWVEPAGLPQQGVFLMTELRTVLVARFPRDAPVETVQGWITRRCHYIADSIVKIHVPRKASPRHHIKGRAHATFSSTARALMAVRLLNHTSFRGHKLRARLANDAQAVMPGWPAQSDHPVPRRIRGHGRGFRRNRCPNRDETQDEAEDLEPEWGFVLPKKTGVDASSDMTHLVENDDVEHGEAEAEEEEENSDVETESSDELETASAVAAADPGRPRARRQTL